MNNLVTKNKVKEVIKTWASALSDAKSSMNKAIRTGELLREINEDLKKERGAWTNLFENELKGNLSIRHAQVLISVYENRILIKSVGNDELLTINEMRKIISDATPEQLAKAEQLKIEEEFKRHQAETEKQRKALEARKAQEKDDGVIEGDFKEVKQEAKKPTIEIPEENPIDLLHETIDELHISNGELIKEIDSITKILDSNDQVSKALAEAKKYREENRVLKERINGLQNEANEAKRTAKYWKGRFEKLEKELVND